MKEIRREWDDWVSDRLVRLLLVERWEKLKYRMRIEAFHLSTFALDILSRSLSVALGPDLIAYTRRMGHRPIITTYKSWNLGMLRQNWTIAETATPLLVLISFSRENFLDWTVWLHTNNLLQALRKFIDLSNVDVIEEAARTKRGVEGNIFVSSSIPEEFGMKNIGKTDRPTKVTCIQVERVRGYVDWEDIKYRRGKLHCSI